MRRRQFFTDTTLQILSFATASNLIPALSLDYDMKRNRKALRLKKGDTLGLIAPGSPVTEEKFTKAVANLNKLGFKLKLGKSVKKADGFLAGTDKERLDDLHTMFADPEVDGVWCIRGGYGCTRLLSDIDYDLIKTNPKVLIGYSDITALLLAIYRKTGLVCFHGPAAVSNFTEYTSSNVQAVLLNPEVNQVIEHSLENDINDKSVFQSYVVNEGIATGRLTGGNLSLISAMIGTEWEMQVKNKIVFIEDIGEAPYRVDRMLTQLMQHYDLNKAAAVMLGVFLGCEAKDESTSWTLKQTITDRLGKLSIPVIYGMSFGHIENMFTLPVGVEATLDTKKRQLTLLEKAVL